MSHLQDAIREYVIAVCRARVCEGPDFLRRKADADAAARRVVEIADAFDRADYRVRLLDVSRLDSRFGLPVINEGDRANADGTAVPSPGYPENAA